MQAAIALVLVLGAACYLAWCGWRAIARTVRARRSGGCGPGCGCGTSR
jgi:threonine/homoserine/homoserine lactone efflux protein